ncbi:facilitated trehalose transporter Tret1-like [Melitaea cinxia]|uniref:facilitated trehalose transporter Tret1-like n=1 Tax=Melitaea cinxia TaxID=113334 RepID=UPI001E272A1F|nr:facilitated trehalose transporter Tret1-like [Melitaea cinxia]
MSSGEFSILGSLANIGGFLSTPFCGYALDKFGRKYSAMVYGVPFVVAWGIIAVTKSMYLDIFGAGLAGLGAGGQAVSTVYISEICHDSIRGGLTSSTIYVFFLGLLFSYTLGGYLPYYSVVYVHLILSILYVALLTLLKESPIFLLKCGKEKEAAESIAFYHRIEKNSKEMELKIKKLKLQLDPRIIKILESGGDDAAVEELLKKSPSTTEKDDESLSVWQFLKRSESSRKGLATVHILMVLSIFMGAMVISLYAELIFKEAVPGLDTNTCSIILAGIYLIACLMGALVLDKFGRKTLMTVSCALCGVFTMLLGSQLHFHYAPPWFSAFALYAFSFTYNFGCAAIPSVVAAEIFLPEVRGFGNSCVMACRWISVFVLLNIFAPLVEAFGLGITYCFFSVVCFLSAAYSHLYLPETKGLSVDAIQKLFVKERTKK